MGLPSLGHYLSALSPTPMMTAMTAITRLSDPRHPVIGNFAVSVIKCLDDPVQPHPVNAKDDVLVPVLARVQESGRISFRKAYLRYPNPITF